MKLALSLVAILAATSPAMAWDNKNNGHNNQIVDGGPGAQANSRSSANAHANSQSRSTSTGGNATGGNANASGGSVSVGSIGGGNGSGSGGGGIALTVPDGIGNAPCGGGIGLGGLGLGGGGSGGGTLWEFADCKRMREASALLHMGFRQAAINELCQIDRVKDAFGGDCPVIDAPAGHTRSYSWDWCGTRNAGDWNQHLECDRAPKHEIGGGRSFRDE